MELCPVALPAAIVLVLGGCGTSGRPSHAMLDGGADGTIPGDRTDASADSADAGLASADATYEASDTGLGDTGVDVTQAPPAVGGSVLTFHNHVNRDGYFKDPLVTVTGASSVSYDPSFHATFSDNLWASPLYVENGVGGNGTFYLATAGNNVYAFGEADGTLLWAKSFGTPASQSYSNGCGNVQPIGITGTPAIDLATRLMVFDAVSGDQTAENDIKTHIIYGVSIDDGATKWSVDVSTLTDSTGLAFSPQVQNQRAAVLIVNGSAYLAYGGHSGDCGNYHGWVVRVSLAGTGATAWATQTVGAGIWGAAGPSSDGESVFVTTGNAKSNVATWQGSEGILLLDPSPSFSGNTQDYFTLNNWSAADQGDRDLGSTAPLVIDSPSVTPSALVLAQGKDGWSYLVNRKNLGGVSSAPDTANVGAIHTTGGSLGAAWGTVAGTTYVVIVGEGVSCPGGTSGELVGMKLDDAFPQKMSVVWCAGPGFGYGVPIISSSDGTNDGLVWAFGAEGDNRLHAFDLATGAAVGVSGAPPLAAGALVRHYSTPLEVHGRVVVGADEGLFAFKMGP
jgi:outer membrane protein assembly factor BamB